MSLHSFVPQQRLHHVTPTATHIAKHAPQPRFLTTTRFLTTIPLRTMPRPHATPHVCAAASTPPSLPATSNTNQLRVTLDTAEAQDSIKFVDVPNRTGADIVLCEVIPDSAAAIAGLRVGQKLLAISDPVRQNEMWQLNDRASFRFVRDAFRMRRWPVIELVVTPDACLADELQAVLQARSMTTTSSDSDSEGGDFFTGTGVMDAVVLEGIACGGGG